MDRSAAGVAGWLRLRETPALGLQDDMLERLSYLQWEREGQDDPQAREGEREALRRLLMELLEGELSESERAALLAGAGGALTQKELGRALGLPPSTAARQLNAAQAKLRPILRGALRYRALLREETGE